MDIRELSDMAREELGKAVPGVEFWASALAQTGTIFLAANDDGPELCAPCRAGGAEGGAFVPRRLLLFSAGEAYVRRHLRGLAEELARRFKEAGEGHIEAALPA